MIEFHLEFQEKTAVKVRKVYLPYLPVKGEANFDIREDGEPHNFSVVDVDTSIADGKFSHGVIYLKNA